MLTGTVTTILGDPSASKPADGFGRAGVLTSGSWWLSCQPDGTVLLADTQTRSWRRICPPGWPEAECASVAPAPAPGRFKHLQVRTVVHVYCTDSGQLMVSCGASVLADCAKALMVSRLHQLDFAQV